MSRGLSSKAVFAVVNPIAGNGQTGRVWPDLHRLLTKQLGSFQWGWTKAPGHAVVLTRKALQMGYKRIISVGGDGTHHEVANAFFDSSGSASPGAVLAPLSKGTGSDLRRSLRLPKEPEEAALVLAHEQTAEIDVGWFRYRGRKGRILQRYYLNILSLGMGGEVDLRVNQTTKALGGFLSFLWATMATVMTYRPKRVRFRVDGDGWWEEPIVLLAAANGQYFGGGMWLAPGAVLTSGQLDVVVVKAMSRLELISQLRKLYKGTHLTHPKVAVYHSHSLLARSNDQVWLDVDGEALGTLPIEVRVLPKALKVLVGPGFGGFEASSD